MTEDKKTWSVIKSSLIWGCPCVISFMLLYFLFRKNDITILGMSPFVSGISLALVLVILYGLLFKLTHSMKINGITLAIYWLCTSTIFIVPWAKNIEELHRTLEGASPSAPASDTAGALQNINFAPIQGLAPDPNLAPSTPGPPGTPGGVPPPGEPPGGIRDGGAFEGGPSPSAPAGNAAGSPTNSNQAPGLDNWPTPQVDASGAPTQPPNSDIPLPPWAPYGTSEGASPSAPAGNTAGSPTNDYISILFIVAIITAIYIILTRRERIGGTEISIYWAYCSISFFFFLSFIFWGQASVLSLQYIQIPMGAALLGSLGSILSCVIIILKRSNRIQKMEFLIYWIISSIVMSLFFIVIILINLPNRSFLINHLSGVSIVGICALILIFNSRLITILANKKTRDIGISIYWFSSSIVFWFLCGLVFKKMNLSLFNLSSMDAGFISGLLVSILFGLIAIFFKRKHLNQLDIAIYWAGYLILIPILSGIIFHLNDINRFNMMSVETGYFFGLVVSLLCGVGLILMGKEKMQYYEIAVYWIGSSAAFCFLASIFFESKMIYWFNFTSAVSGAFLGVVVSFILGVFLMIRNFKKGVDSISVFWIGVVILFWILTGLLFDIINFSLFNYKPIETGFITAIVIILLSEIFIKRKYGLKSEN